MSASNDTSLNLLSFWQEWKDVCAVFRCSPDTQSRLESLICRCYRSFCNTYNVSYPKNEDVVTWFDTYILECSQQDKKQWKNYVWNLIEERPNEPPLKIIHGKLLGPRGLLWNVFREAYSKVQNCVSIDDNVKVSVVGHSNNWISDEVDYAVKILSKQFDRREKVMFVAKISNISVADPCVHHAAGIGKDACSRAWQSALGKYREMAKNEEIGEIIRQAEFVSVFNKFLKSELESEKGAVDLLNKIKLRNAEV